MKPSAWAEELRTVVREGEAYGKSAIGASEKRRAIQSTDADRLERDVEVRELERCRLAAEAARALVVPARHHETNGSQATSHFLSGINRRERMRMKPRGARGGRHEHDDGPYEAVKHTPREARRMPLC